MLMLRLGIAALLTVASPWLCSADSTTTFVDSTEAASIIFSGATLRCESAETCGISISPGGFVSPGVDLSFNIFDQDGVTLSDTLQITSPAGSFFVDATFQSDIEGTPLASLPGGTKMIEDGTVQTAATVPTGTPGGDLVFQFQSDVTEVPEPATFTLLGVGALGLLSGRRRRWLRRGRAPSGAERLG
jgi:hypothetical protein